MKNTKKLIGNQVNKYSNRKTDIEKNKESFYMNQILFFNYGDDKECKNCNNET